MSKTNLWAGLNDAAQAELTSRDYKARSFTQRVAEIGVEAGELAAIDSRKPDAKKIWIPGVEIFSRQVHPQRHRGIFGEFARRDERSEERRVGEEGRSRGAPCELK